MKLLHIDSSILGAGSASRALSAQIVAAERQLHPNIAIIYRDLAAEPGGQLSGAHLAAFQGASPEAVALRADIASGQAALEEFLASDIVVIGAPMYNFGIPSSLKAWFDYVLHPGVTFQYGEGAPKALLTGKRAIVILSRGGFYSDGPAKAYDSQEPHLRALLGFIGITDVTFIYAERLAMGLQVQEAALATATGEIERAVEACNAAA